MKISYRQGVFETNSSSVHTFSIKPSGDIKDLMKIPSLTLRGGEFGWGPDKIEGWQEKAEYLVQLADSLDDKDLLEQITEVLHECGIEEVIFKPEGYVDHANDKDELVDLLKENKEYVKDFIFGKGFILIDNDENYPGYQDAWEENGLSTAPNSYGSKDLIRNKFTFSC